VRIDPAPDVGDTTVQGLGGVPAQDGEQSCQSSVAARRGSPPQTETAS
jgi:hypothetical protein